MLSFLENSPSMRPPLFLFFIRVGLSNSPFGPDFSFSVLLSDLLLVSVIALRFSPPPFLSKPLALLNSRLQIKFVSSTLSTTLSPLQLWPYVATRVFGRPRPPVALYFFSPFTPLRLCHNVTPPKGIHFWYFLFFFSPRC